MKRWLRSQPGGLRRYAEGSRGCASGRRRSPCSNTGRQAATIPFMKQATRRASLDHERWRTPTMVLACAGLVLMLALGIRQSFGLFLQPMSIDFGCGRPVFSFAIALQNLVWGLAMPFAGAIADRKGAGRVIVAGAAFYALGLYSMGHSTSALQFDWSAGLLVGLGLSGTGFGVVL